MQMYQMGGSDLHGQIKSLSNSHAGYQDGAELSRARKKLRHLVKSVLRRASMTGTQHPYSGPGSQLTHTLSIKTLLVFNMISLMF